METTNDLNKQDKHPIAVDRAPGHSRAAPRAAGKQPGPGHAGSTCRWDGKLKEKEVLTVLEGPGANTEQSSCRIHGA